MGSGRWELLSAWTLVVSLVGPGGARSQPADAAASPTRPKPAATAPHRIVLVSASNARRPVEVSVAINPLNADHIVAASTQAGIRGEGTSNYTYMSEDGGLSWQTRATLNPEHRIQGDDSVAFGPDGRAHHCYMAFTGIRTDRPLQASSGLFTTVSRDGVAWSRPATIVDHLNSVEPHEDKPYLAIDRSESSPFRGNFYVSWTRFEVYGSKDPAHKSHIFFARSLDGGEHFQPIRRLSDTPGDCVDSSNTVEGAMPAVGPKGELYVTWAGPKGIVFKKSTDGGWSFTPEKTITEVVGGWDSPAPGFFRHNGMPVSATDISRGPNRGSLYVAWIDRRNKDLDVFLIASRDGGQTWASPVRVNDDPVGNGKDQLFTWMTVDPIDGSVNLIFYDRRDLAETMTGLTLARSTDGGKTFVNYRLQQPAFACHPDVFFGDYSGIAAQGGRVVALYSHFTGRRDVALSAALFRFKPGTQEALPVPPDVPAPPRLPPTVSGAGSH